MTKIISSGSSLYVAGGFSTFGGVHAPVLAKVDPVTGMADPQFSRGAGFEGELNQDPGLKAAFGLWSYRETPCSWAAYSSTTGACHSWHSRRLMH